MKEEKIISRNSGHQKSRVADFIGLMLVSFVSCIFISWFLVPTFYEANPFDEDFFKLSFLLAFGPALIIGKILIYISKPDSQNFSNNNSHYNEKETSISDKIIELKKLYDQGVITKDEFNRLKSEILNVLNKT